jgi:hypothetical protein
MLLLAASIGVGILFGINADVGIPLAVATAAMSGPALILLVVLVSSQLGHHTTAATGTASPVPAVLVCLKAFHHHHQVLLSTLLSLLCASIIAVLPQALDHQVLCGWTSPSAIAEGDTAASPVATASLSAAASAASAAATRSVTLHMVLKPPM